jgi:hypothetical protein
LSDSPECRTIRRATYRAKDDAIAIKLTTGVEIVVPRMLLQGLENATRRELADVEIVDAHSGLHWEAQTLTTIFRASLREFLAIAAG